MKYIKHLALIAAAAGAIHLTACSDSDGDHDGHDHSGHEHGDHQREDGDAKSGGEEHAKKEASTLKPYPLDFCLVSGEKLGSMGEPPVIEHEGQQIKFCCGGCEDDFKADTAKFLAKMKEAVAAKAAK